MDHNLNVKIKALKLLEEHRGESLHLLDLAMTFWEWHQPQAERENW